MNEHSFPSHYPRNCPPKPFEERCGRYYLVVRNLEKENSEHYKSFHETNRAVWLESTKACDRRSLSMFADRNDAINLSLQFPGKGKYIAVLDLNGGHGVVRKDSRKSHHSWWIPIGVIPANFCSNIEVVH